MRIHSSLLVAASMLMLPACLTPNPAEVHTPNAKLGALLGELQDARGGSFETDAAGEPRREAALQREVEALATSSPRFVPGLVASAALLYQEGDRINAQKYLDQALSIEPGHVQATLLRVRIAAESGNLPYARRKLDEQLELTPDVADLREARSGVLFLLGQYDEALTELDLADRFRPDDELRWRTDYHRGLILQADGDSGAALAMFRRSQDANPDFHPAASHMRWIEASSGRAQ